MLQNKKDIKARMNNKIVNIVWFRNDLRLSDNPALFESVKLGNILPIYIFDDPDPSKPDQLKIGAASKYWLHHSLESLNKSLNNKLNIYSGKALDILQNIVSDSKLNIETIFYNKCYEPWYLENDKLIEEKVRNIGLNIKGFNASLLWEPNAAVKHNNDPYKIFTPFYKNCILNLPSPRDPLPAPDKLPLISDASNKLTISDLELLPKIKWHKEIEEIWNIGEQVAQEKITSFLDNNVLQYTELRNFPSIDGTSTISPHIHFGEISAHQIWSAGKYKGETIDAEDKIEPFLRQLAWREFSYHMLYHFPKIPTENYKKKFDNFPWEENNNLLKAWQKGLTGYPIVDAGMRELYRTGNMHNRVRMIVGSFLVKNLMIHWKHGANWFWEHLLDADLANNSAGWQWVAGSGTDAAPYFRIFSPISQGERFDTNGEYTRKYVPELKDLPDKYLFKPWQAPKHLLESLGITLGKDYPKPIIDIKVSRQKALEAYADYIK